MLATHRVKDKVGNTVGFMVDDNYYSCSIIKNNIDNIDNLYIADNKIKSTSGKLKVISLLQVNNIKYQKLCKENPIKRDVQKDFRKWKTNRHRDILYVEGARQTGKTTELRKFAYNNYEQVIYVNLSDKVHLGKFLSLVINNASKLFGLNNYCKGTLDCDKYIDNSDTILIIDEIQDNVDVYNSLRTLQSALKCDIAVTGSFLGRTINKEFMIPVDNTYNVEMTPLSFREFCRNYNADGTFPEEDYKVLMQLYDVYRQIGGYPRVANMYFQTKSIEACWDIIADLLNRYIQESRRYIDNDKSQLIFENVYKAAAIMQVREKKGTENNIVELTSKFINDNTGSIVDRKEVNGAISWLVHNGVLGTCDLYKQGDAITLFPKKRLYFRDCGLLNYVLSTTAIKEDVKQGLIAETFVYNELYRLYKNRANKG